MRIADAIAFAALAFAAGMLTEYFYKDTEHEAHLRHYRSVLIRNGLARYDSDETGEPVFGIQHRETQPTTTSTTTSTQP